MMYPVAWVVPKREGSTFDEYATLIEEIADDDAIPLVRLSDAEARIKELTKWRDEWKDMATEFKGLTEEWQARAEAAEALLKEAGNTVANSAHALESAIEWMSCVEGHLRDGTSFKRDQAVIRVVLAAARSIAAKIGGKDE